jgi:hypothetical protein
MALLDLPSLKNQAQRVGTKLDLDQHKIHRKLFEMKNSTFKSHKEIPNAFPKAIVVTRD